MNEARYSRLTREFPDRAGVLFQRNEDEPPRLVTSTCSSSSRCTTSKPHGLHMGIGLAAK